MPFDGPSQVQADSPAPRPLPTLSRVSDWFSSVDFNVPMDGWFHHALSRGDSLLFPEMDLDTELPGTSSRWSQAQRSQTLNELSQRCPRSNTLSRTVR
jgi:hypothetical protein